MLQILSNVKNKEIDGDLLFAMEDDEVGNSVSFQIVRKIFLRSLGDMITCKQLEEHLNMDPLLIKKVRKKIDGVPKDDASEAKVSVRPARVGLHCMLRLLDLYISC